MQAAKRHAVETEFTGYGQLSIYTPTGNHLATRRYTTPERRAAIIARYEIGKVYQNA